MTRHQRLSAIEAELARLRWEVLNAGTYVPVGFAPVRAAANHAAAAFRVEAADIIGSARDAHIVQARFATCWVARKAFKLSYPAIGRVLGKRDHTTILAACRRAEQMRAADATFRSVTDTLLAMLTPKQEAQP